MRLESHTDEHGIAVVAIEGELDYESSSHFFAVLETMIDQGQTRIIVDCGNLDLVSSYGLSALFRLHVRMRKHGGDVKLASLKGIVRDLFQMMRLNQVLHVHRDVDDARQSLLQSDAEAPGSEPP